MCVCMCLYVYVCVCVLCMCMYLFFIDWACSITRGNTTRYGHIVDFLLREEQWLWICTALLQLVSCFCFTSLLCMIQLYVLITICYRSSKSIDSIKAVNEFRQFVMSSCLLAGQFPFLSMFCFRTSLCVWIIEQWFSRWARCLVVLSTDARCVVT